MLIGLRVKTASLMLQISQAIWLQIVFSINDKLPEEELRVCVQMAFAYHRSKNT